MPVKGKLNVDRAIAAAKNIDIAFEAGNALIVALTGATFTGTVDFQSTVDGSNYVNCPYKEQHDATPARSVAQIVDPGAYKEYVLLGPLSQARIAITRSAGSLTVVWREVRYDMEDAA